MSDKPLVSCVMPTKGRPEMVERAYRYFFEQDYPNKELVILSTDWEDVPKPLRGAHGIVRHYMPRVEPATLGEKRNLVNLLACGPLVMHWDDDDWYRSDRISLQVEALGDADICGLSRHLFYKPETDQTWLYSYPHTGSPWLAGGTCLYRRSLWERRPFPDVQEGSDTQWMWGWPDIRVQGYPERKTFRAPALTNDIVVMVDILDYSWYVATVHDSNTSPKLIGGECWKEWSGDIHALMEDRARVQIV